MRPTGQAVPAEVLADAVWGEAPPKTWGKVVQGSVMRLRRAVGSSAIETTAGGYRIVLPEGSWTQSSSSTWSPAAGRSWR